MTQNGALSKNMRLLGQNDLGGFGNCGEGMAIQITRDRRRVLWICLLYTSPSPRD